MIHCFQQFANEFSFYGRKRWETGWIVLSDKIRLSKFISLVLRHRPEIISLKLDDHGWCNVGELIDQLNRHGKSITHDILQDIVNTDTKQRYSYNENHTKIRANQGHSIKVDLELKEEEPPEFLYHGTVEKFVGSIMRNGLQKRQRQFVHMSYDIETAEAVARRKGDPVILKIHSGKMFCDGYNFYKSKNNVWLCNSVPSNYIEELKMNTFQRGRAIDA